jgi:DNA repair exonuclease SbcCD nuclease subunit
MIKFILCADTHLGFDYPINPRIDRRRRGKDFFRNFQKVLDFAVDEQADFVIHGGDFFFRSKLPEKIINIGYEMLLDFSKYNIPFILVPGNHERAQLPLSILLNTKNILIFDKPRTFTFTKNKTTIQIHGFPFVRDTIKEHFGSIIHGLMTNSSSEDIHILCMHQIVKSARLERYVFSHGENVIPHKMIPLDLDLIVSGHIHRAQIVQIRGLLKTVPVIYPGSVERTSFQEKNEDKGFYVLECDKRNSTFTWNADFHTLPTRAMITLDLDLINTDIEDVLHYLNEKIAVMDNNAILRLISHKPEIRERLTASSLREIVPRTMNIKLYPRIIR